MRSIEHQTRLRRLLSFGVGLALAITTAIVLAASVGASAADTESLSLQPGDNDVGWVGEPIAVADIFEQIPQASLIYRWDAISRSFVSATADDGGDLETIEPGMAVTIRVDGRRSVKWERPLTPAKGSVTLYSGVNWVSWLGREDWPLDQVARGIGTSLVSIRVDGRTWPMPLDDSVDELPSLRRGDALEVTVSRDLRWLQPTGIMPNIVFVGDTSESLQNEITGDVRRILDFLTETFAVEADFSETTILLFSSIDAAVEHAESGQEPRFTASPRWLRGMMEGGQLAQAQPWGFYMPSCRWPSSPTPACHGGTIGTVAHELFHLFQDQLSTRDPHLSPTWMSEGSATWLDWLVHAEFNQASYDEHREWVITQVAQTKEPLQAGENGFYDWLYRLGSVVTDRLVETHGIDAILNFDRALFPQVIGKERRWLRAPTWHEAFEMTFGLTVEAFYDEFASWRETLPEPTQTSKGDTSDVKLSGTLRHFDGSPAAGSLVFARQYVGEVHRGLARTAVVDETGGFSVDVAPNTIQRLRVAQDGCELWLTNDGLAAGQVSEDEYAGLDTRNLPKSLDLTLPEGACENEIRVDVIRLRGDDRTIGIVLNSEDGETHVHVATDHLGTYTTRAPEAGRYRVRVWLDYCGLWYQSGGLVASEQRGELIELSEVPVTISVRIPADLCAHQISGRLVTTDGSPLAGVEVFADSDGPSSWAPTVADGTFSITVPSNGDYSLRFGADDCWIRYGVSGPTTVWDEATLVTVDDADVTGIEFVVPDDSASLCR